MKFEEQLNRYSALKVQLANPRLNENEKSDLKNEFDEVYKYLFNTYMIVRLKTGIDKQGDLNFDNWINKEIEQNNYINNLLSDDDYDEAVIQLQEFDNLGFDNDFVVDWRNKIFQELESLDIKMSDFYYSDMNKSNKDLLEHIVLKSETYTSLNNKGLLNRGYCPITGEKIGTSYSYNMYNRHIYLSKTGLEICRGVERNNWKGKNMSYDEFTVLKEKNKAKSKKQATLVVFILVLLSIIISWNFVEPSGFFSFLGFLVVGFIVFFVLGWIFNFLWDMIVG